MTRGNVSLTLALGSAMAFATASAEAAIWVDFNEAHVAGGDWETIAEPSTTPVTLSDGTTLTFPNIDGGVMGDSTQTQSASNSGYAGTLYEGPANDYFWDSGTASGFVIGNLVSGTLYNLELISARGTTAGSDIDITANDLPATGTHDGANYSAMTDGWVDGTVLRWDNLTPDVDGNITVWFEPNGGSWFANGFVLEVVPEPASLALVGLGGMMLLRRRAFAH